MRVLNSIERLGSLCLELFELDLHHTSRSKHSRSSPPIRDRAFLVEKISGQYTLEGGLARARVNFRPGTVFSLYLAGSGKQIALLAAKALHYHPQRQKYEKRLARYLTWRWRIGASKWDYFKPYRVETLVHALRLPIDRRFPNRLRSRFEKALERLEADGLLAGFMYRGWAEPPGYKWLDDWLDTMVVVEPPDKIVDSYQNIGGRNDPSGTDLAERLRVRRANERMSRLRAAEQIGIPPEELLAAERGLSVERSTRTKAQQWLDTKVAS